MTATEQQDLVQALIAAQGEMSDRAFARRLGISASLWSLTKRGRVPVGMSLIRAAMRHHPDLQAEALISLRRESTIRNK